MLTAVVQNTQPDYVALAMVLAMAVIVVIMAVRKKMSNKKKTEISAIPTEVAAKPAAPGSAGQLKLYDVEPKTAAMVMAIVADQLGKPLNELRFISIKEAQ